MRILLRALEIILMVGIAALVCSGIGNMFNGTAEEKQARARKWGWYGVALGILIIIVRSLNTVNYILYLKGKRVYDGITKHNRIAQRMREHLKGGKVFDKYCYSQPTFRFRAIAIEKMRIRRFRGKYNVQHNS